MIFFILFAECRVSLNNLPRCVAPDLFSLCRRHKRASPSVNHTTPRWGKKQFLVFAVTSHSGSFTYVGYSIDDLDVVAFQSYGDDIHWMRVKIKEAIFIKTHTLGSLVGWANAVSLGPTSFHKEEFMPIDTCSLLVFVCKTPTSIWCVSFHVDQIRLLV